MSSITNNRNQDRLRHLHGEGERNHSALGIGASGSPGAKPADIGADDPIAVSLHMEALDQNVVESNHKVSSAISFVQTQNEILSKYSNTFIKIAELRDGSTDSPDAEPGDGPATRYKSLVGGLPRVDGASFNNEPLFNADPLRVSIYNNVPEPHVSAVDLERPDLGKITKVSRDEGIPIPLVNTELDAIPSPWLDEALASLGDLIFSNKEQEIQLEELRKSLRTGVQEDVRGLEAPQQAHQLVEDAGLLLLSSLDTGNAYKVQAHLSFGAVTAMLR